jgi:hypothetical protein
MRRMTVAAMVAAGLVSTVGVSGSSTPAAHTAPVAPHTSAR